MGTISLQELDTRFKYDIASLPGGENLQRCFACGTCSGGCLITEVTGPEYDPRKIIRMAIYGMKEQILASPTIWLCLLCHNCTFHCPQDVKFSEIMGALRHLAVKEGYVQSNFYRKLAFGFLLPSRIRLEIMTRPLTLYQKLGLSAPVRKSGILRMMPEGLRALEPVIPPLPFRPLSKRLKTLTPARGETKHRVTFFQNCADNVVFGNTGMDTVMVLAENNCEVVTPKTVQCCGMPFFGYGEMERARKLARHNIDVFSEIPSETVITDCATCGSFLKGYAALLADDPIYAEKALAFSHKVQDISEFLVETLVFEPELGEVAGRVTYHDPCHLVWAQKVVEAPRRVLQAIPGLELAEMNERGTCCGGAGSYNLTHYETSMQILDRKMTNVKATGAAIIATGCPGCRLQLSLGVQRHGLAIRVVHPIELLAQAYKNKS